MDDSTPPKLSVNTTLHNAPALLDLIRLPIPRNVPIVSVAGLVVDRSIRTPRETWDRLRPRLYPSDSCEIHWVGGIEAQPPDHPPFSLVVVSSHPSASSIAEIYDEALVQRNAIEGLRGQLLWVSQRPEFIELDLRGTVQLQIGPSALTPPDSWSCPLEATLVGKAPAEMVEARLLTSFNERASEGWNYIACTIPLV